MRNEYDFSQSRKNPYSTEEEARSDISAKLGSDTLANSPATSASDWDDALTSRSTIELRAQVSKRRANNTSTKRREDPAQLAALVHARLARGRFVAVDPKDL